LILKKSDLSTIPLLLICETLVALKDA